VHFDYAFRVRGRLTPTLKVALKPLEAKDATADTVLVARGADRAALHGFIARIEAVGLELVELRRLPVSSDKSGHQCPACGCGDVANETASRSRG
jgi:hypothetical protein